MKIQHSFFYLSFIFLGLILSTCNNDNSIMYTEPPTKTATVSVADTQLPNQSECIPPVVTLAYEYNVPPAYGEEEAPIYPGGKWRYVDDLPVLDEDVEEIVAWGDDEIWVEFSHRGGLWKYQPSSGNWKVYSSIGEFENIPPHILRSFPNVTNNNDLWAIGYVRYDQIGEVTIPSNFFFNKYNEKTDRFEFVRSDENLVDSYSFYKSNIKQDPDGVFWIMAQKENIESPGTIVSGRPFTLISFQPATGEVTEHGEFPYYSYFVIAPNGDLWILVENHDEKLYLQQFIPESNEIIDHPDLPPFDEKHIFNIGALYFDRNNRLWMGDRGWIDFSEPEKPSWFEMIRSPVFITDRAEGLSRYAWVHPYRMYESSDGLYWFESYFGLVRLNPQSGEWCKFTNARSPFAEDSHQNLWIAVFGRLYKYPLGE